MDADASFRNESRQTTFVAANITVLVVAIISVALRTWSRRINRTQLGLDDYTIFVALFLAMSHVASQLAACHYGLGRHMIVLSNGQVTAALKAFVASQLIWAATIATIKVSILLLYTKIFGIIRYFRVAAYLIGGLTVAWALMSLFVLAFQCRPLAHMWDPTIKASCINRNVFYEFCSAINSFTDAAILVIPLPAVWRIKISFSRRLQLSAIFLIGALTVAISVARLVSIFELVEEDLTWNLTTPCIWSAAEPCLAITAACMATLRPLLAACFGHDKQRSKASGRSAKALDHRRTGGSGSLESMQQSKRDMNSVQEV